MHSDEFESVVDADSGEERKGKVANASKAFQFLIDWATKRRGGGFPLLKKQYKALGMMRAAGFKTEQVMQRWEELEKDKFYEMKGFDFMDVLSSLNKKPPL